MRQSGANKVLGFLSLGALVGLIAAIISSCSACMGIVDFGDPGPDGRLLEIPSVEMEAP